MKEQKLFQMLLSNGAFVWAVASDDFEARDKARSYITERYSGGSSVSVVRTEEMAINKSHNTLDRLLV